MKIWGQNSEGNRWNVVLEYFSQTWLQVMSVLEIIIPSLGFYCSLGLLNLQSFDSRASAGEDSYGLTDSDSREARLGCQQAQQLEGR